jgi:hypothetical protein
MEDRLASTRAWLEPIWRARYADHPIGRIFGRRLIWTISQPVGPGASTIPDGGGWLGADGRRLQAGAKSEVRLWHPADADGAEISAWRANLAAANHEQPIRQADREVVRPLARDLGLAADRRFAGRVVDHGQLRALLRGRGWAVPALGAWDQGDEATAFRTFDGGLRAELRYQTVERVPTGSRPGRATSGPGSSPSGSSSRPMPVRALPRVRNRGRSPTSRRGSSRRRSATSAWSRLSRRRRAPTDGAGLADQATMSGRRYGPVTTTSPWASKRSGPVRRTT